MTSFVPMPSKRKRGVLRWVIFAVHMLPFALIILLYPTLEALFANTMLRLGMLSWGMLVVLHLIIVSVLDFRENIQFYRRERARQQMIAAQKKRQRMMSQLYVTPTDDETL
ncbi:MAG: hypothetical protein CUN56_10360 [Phototrophicales bacterium]|nr:MAG: hypothetical protein CUN56_10360 [Phototrophicales bacterium]RMG74110.1 MAG: hypothetical protein D6711_09585 [Chloroflexota bacterium]